LELFDKDPTNSKIHITRQEHDGGVEEFGMPKVVHSKQVDMLNLSGISDPMLNC